MRPRSRSVARTYRGADKAMSAGESKLESEQRLAAAELLVVY